MRSASWLLPLAALLAAPVLAAPVLAADVTFTAEETARILRHGPWPPPWSPDPGNRVSGDPAAADLGRRLFFDARLPGPQGKPCAGCHDPARAFADGRPVAEGIRPGRRNTPGLMDVRHRRWFGWDGASDSLWAASLRPILDAGEMGGGIATVAALIRDDAAYRTDFAAVFGTPPARLPPEAVAVAAAKALAAFQETLVSPRTPFDDFRDALASGDAAARARYPAAARRGLKLFVGRGDCGTCHYGPGFSNGAFADIGRPHFLPDGGVDPGRHGGIAALRASPYTRLGPWSDDRDGPAAIAVRHLAPHPRNWGEFKVPSLRGLAATAPYMHDGSLPTLDAVLRHYSEVDEERLHADREKLVRPLRLTAAEIADLAAFLATLSPE